MRSLLLVALLSVAGAAGAEWPLSRASSMGAPQQPHPSVARIKVPEQGGTAYGSGTLVDARDEYGLVLTNWHVVQAATGPIEVRFPDGFVSQARSLKVDSDWDLAALVVWRPTCQPVKLSPVPPRPGDRLTICGYGAGDYRAVSGRCTQFYAPRLDLPQELVELDVQARQGDSGGPIFNDRGELAGVLFGAGQGTTLGSYEGRVKTFLASLAPDIGQNDSAPKVALKPADPPRETCPTCPNCERARSNTVCQGGVCRPRSDLGDVCFGCDTVAEHAAARPQSEDAVRQDEWPAVKPIDPPSLGWSSGKHSASAPAAEGWPLAAPGDTTAVVGPAPRAASPTAGGGMLQSIKTALAAVGAVAIGIQLLRLAV